MKTMITLDHIKKFQDDGFLIIESLYDTKEMELLLNIGKNDKEKNKLVHAPRDA